MKRRLKCKSAENGEWGAEPTLARRTKGVKCRDIPTSDQPH